MGSRFVRPDTTALHISQGDTLTVKRRLNAGERRQYLKFAYHTAPDGQLSVNTLETGLAMVLAYLIDWTLTDEHGGVIPIRGQSIDAVRSALDALEPDDFTEIKNAIEAHEDAMQQEREREKKVTAGATESSAIAPSQLDSTSPTSG